MILLVTMVAACGGDDGGGGLCPLDVRSATVDANFGRIELDALIEATGRFSAEVTGLDEALLEACNNISTDLGGAEGATTQVACQNASDAVEAKLAASPGVALLVTVTEPVCSVSAQAVIDCTAECDVNFDASATPPTCTGGELSGSCSGSCSGECTVEGSVTCEGSCTGSCSGQCTGSVSGSCTGTCNGQCEGTCSAMGPNGECQGTCTGTCSGSCTGTIEGECSGSCEGTCEGSCRSDLMGSCSGSCSGSCDVAFTEPRCEGGHFEVDADADCKAACESEASFDVECDDPTVVITYTGPGSADVEAVIATIETNYPAIADAVVRLPIIAEATVDLASRADDAAGAAVDVGVQGVACLAAAAGAAAGAAATVSVNVMVSVEVQGSVTTN